jgi:hypothetical protein
MKGDSYVRRSSAPSSSQPRSIQEARPRDRASRAPLAGVQTSERLPGEMPAGRRPVLRRARAWIRQLAEIRRARRVADARRFRGLDLRGGRGSDCRWRHRITPAPAPRTPRAKSNAYGGSSTALGLAATSLHPQHAGVQIALLEKLLETGANIDQGAASDSGSAIAGCLANGQPDAAAYLASRGAVMNLARAGRRGDTGTSPQWHGTRLGPLRVGQVRRPGPRSRL